MKTILTPLITVDYLELNDSITKFLKLKELPIPINGFNIVENEELSNSSSKVFLVEANEPPSHYLCDFRAGNYMYKTYILLDWMCYEKVIPGGDYLVNICW